jgi:hypothetical protein
MWQARRPVGMASLAKLRRQPQGEREFSRYILLKVKIAEGLFAFRLKTSRSQSAPIKQKAAGKTPAAYLNQSFSR